MMPLYKIEVGKSSIKGIVDVNGGVRRNLQLRQFWSLLTSILLDTSVALRDTGGSQYSVNYGSSNPDLDARIVLGQGTDPPSFGQYNLVQYSKELPTNKVVSDVSGTPPYTRVTLSTTADIDAQELGIRQDIRYYYLLTRTVQQVAIGDVLNYHLEFKQPWLKNFALFWFGKLNKSNVDGVLDVTGASRTLRTAGDTTAGTMRLLISEDIITWSPTLYSIPNAVELTDYHWTFWSNDNYVVLVYLASIIPAVTMTVNTIGIVQRLYDSGGNQFDALLAALDISSSPLTLEANKHNFIMLKFVFH
ncbi:hypothetical protein [Alphaspiravirus yamagawaense]|uniref:Uncharacterized protein n=1 Tax=Alphaspiravirus yamagawaense TaxID=1157339 RepID=J7Q7I3_9VIRU|nr:hypothetical protein [Aeropyrum coil-shaped virus]CCG27822.1 hypothetical protein [Aeropyrum coil-shaped virus]